MNSQLVNDTIKARDYSERAESFFIGKNHDSALVYFDRAASIYLSNRTWGRYVKSLNGKCRQLWELKNYYKALTLADSIEQIAKEKLGQNHIQNAKNYSNMMLIYSLQGDTIKMKEFAEKQIEVLQLNLGEKHPRIAEYYRNTGLCYYYKNDYNSTLRS